MIQVCNACHGLFAGGIKTCPPCVEAILTEAANGRPTRLIAADRDMTKGQVIGLVHRNKPEGFRHPGAPKTGGRRSARALTEDEKQTALSIVQAGGSINHVMRILSIGRKTAVRCVAEAQEETQEHHSDDPKDPHGCRHIAGDPKDPDWAYCQHSRVIGSSYCAYHHSICRSGAAYNAAPA